MSDLHRFTDDADGMAPSRGCFNGIAASAVIFAAVAVLILAMAHL